MDIFEIRIEKNIFYWKKQVSVKEVEMTDVTYRRYNKILDEIEFYMLTFTFNIKKRIIQNVPTKEEVINLNVYDFSRFPSGKSWIS